MQALRIGLLLQPYTGAMPPHEYSIGPELIYKKPLTVGLVWLDAHGDFNTPETTLI